MKQLEEIAAKFGVSKAVYLAKVDDAYGTVTFTIKNKYVANYAKADDPVTRIIAAHYHESLDSARQRFVNSTNLHSTYMHIVAVVVDYYVDNSQLKNPRQSGLYKWIVKMKNEYNHPVSEGFLALYRYIHSPTTSSANTLAILGLMKEKHETSD
jgi:hypothetical protein